VPVDIDEEELAKKFHAMPLNKEILEHKDAPPHPKAKRPLTQPHAPKLSTYERLGAKTRQPEKKDTTRTSTKRQPSVRNGPVFATGPALHSASRHERYQAEFKEKVKRMEEEDRKKRAFKAQPMPVHSTPRRVQSNSTPAPLTEPMPFSMPGNKFSKQAQAKAEMLKKKREEDLRQKAQVKAIPVPSAIHNPFCPKPSKKPLTNVKRVMLSSERRAIERAEFDRKVKEQREREELARQKELEEKELLEQEMIKKLRAEILVFHAQPLPDQDSFVVAPSSKHLTEPISPSFSLKRGGSSF